MPTHFQFDFPPEEQMLREPVLSAIRWATAGQTLSSVREAQRLSAAWLTGHPNDYAVLDAGETLAMLGEALVVTEPQSALSLSRT